MNAWTNNFFHDSKGKILGSYSDIGNGKIKAEYENKFLGWYIDIYSAKIAVEDYHKQGDFKDAC